MSDAGIVITAMKARELGPKSVVVGDHVNLVGDVSGSEGSLARIVEVQQRKNSLSRTVDDAAQVERTIVSNIDQLIIVVAATNPEPRRGLIDRFLVSAFDQGITPIILLTKLDLAPMPEFISEYKNLGVQILMSSRKEKNSEISHASLDAINRVLQGKVSVLVGHSGVGKSTIINALIPAATRITGDVNDVTGRGRHTSSSAIAMPLHKNSGWIIDTPGIRAFGLSHIDPNRIVAAFAELKDVAATCMTNCSHNEEGCALNEWAAPSGNEIPERVFRLASLRSLLAAKDSASPHSQ